MSINLNVFQALPQGGFTFNVLGACKAEKVNLSEACTIHFTSDNGTYKFQSIGNVTRGNFQAYPGIAGFGVWLATAYTLLITIVILGVLLDDIGPRWMFRKIERTDSRGRIHTTTRFLGFVDPRDTPSKFRETIRAIVLNTADMQMVLVIAQIINFVTKGKCSLSAYHFRAAVNAMLISFSSIVLSIAAVRSYWRSKPAAIIRVLISTAIFICMSLVLFSGTKYGSDWPPPSNTNDSLILLPVACLLEADLWDGVQSQLAKQPHHNLNTSLGFPYEFIFMVILGGTFVIAHTATLIRKLDGRNDEGTTRIRVYWNKWHGVLATIYWLIISVSPSVIALYCWLKIGFARHWVSGSGWLGSPNLEDDVWQTGQLVPLLTGILLLITICNEMGKKTEKREELKEEGTESERTEDEVELMAYRHEVSRDPYGVR
ncbi:hypothetical protein BGZ60DRAFT_525852 [Tricladium varicosporioides]|nr:hypothetical protein BGZ60DRAFT_525852 [Hymenoscyphus varicosporioides]